MPEGDTVWQAAARLRRLDGQTLTIGDLRIPSLATQDLAGAAVITTSSRGKHLLMRMDNALTLHSHLRMDGVWAVHPAGTRWRRPAHTARAVLRTSTIEAVGFTVVLDLVATADEDTLVGHLGPDLLDPAWGASHRADAIGRMSAAPAETLADALLNQRNLAGVGNVYKSEICFLLGLDPRTPVAEVPDVGRVVDLAHRLLVANRDRRERVTTGVDRRGHRTWAYGRRGPCLRCGTPIAREEVGPDGRERVTYWCPRCQPAP